MANVSVVERLTNFPILMKDGRVVKAGTPDAAGAVDVNPVTRTQVKLYRETFTLSPLDDEELGIFKAQFVTLLAAPGSEERKLMLDRLSAYIIALRSIKSELNSIKFRGLNPEDTELGFGHIRPIFVYDGAAAARDNWQVVLTNSATYQAWIGDALTTPYTIGNSFGLVITHLKSLTTPSPFMSECKFEVGRSGILIPADVRGLRIGDTENGVSIVPIHTIITKPKSSLLATARADVAGTDEVALGGLVIGLGRALKATDTYPTT